MVPKHRNWSAVAQLPYREQRTVVHMRGRKPRSEAQAKRILLAHNKGADIILIAHMR
jgi:hypothetical protein